MSDLLVNIAFPSSALRQLFTYRINPENKSVLAPGQRVVAPLRNVPTIGFVAGTGITAPGGIKLKTIIEIIDPEPLIPEDLFRFLIKLSDYYLAPLGKTLSAAIPSEYQIQKHRQVFTVDPRTDSVPEPYLQLFAKISSTDSILLSSLKRQFDKETLAHGIEILKKLKKISETPLFSAPQYRPLVQKRILLADNFNTNQPDILNLKKRAPRQWEILEHLQIHQAIPQQDFINFSMAAIKTLSDKQLIIIEETEISDDIFWKEILSKEKTVSLTDEQNLVTKEIAQHIGSDRFAPFLIQGVTGSGKTEVYLKLIKKTLAIGKSALVLVPEITLTTHLASRFRGEFKDTIAIWHSHLSSTQRNTLWKKIRDGLYPIVIGARSAVLLPIRHLGLIIIDEEQDGSFKQRDQEPKYHARDAALMRAVEARAVVVMGSATPSLESLYNAAIGKFQKLELKKRYSNAPSATIEIVDMKAEWKSTGDFENPISRLLKEKIAEKLDRNEQILLLQNRRGYSNVILCPDCGWTPKCRNCDISLTYHKNAATLLCHYCNLIQQPPVFCPNCQSSKFLYPGFGTQRVETCLQDAFPNHKIVRLDIDSTRKQGFSQRVMREFESGNIDIILGTQMIAKGLDFHNVTLVGVLNADIGLFMPDFRARERVFHLLYQVAGRAGRGKIQGEVFIQSFNPQDITIRFAMQQNIAKFTALELNERNPINYPPFSRLAAILFSGLNESQVREAAETCTHYLKQHNKKLEVLGPTPAPISKIKNRYRYLSIIKSRKETDPNGTRLRSVLKSFLVSVVYQSQSRQVRISVDIDPMDLL
ncbi:primosomal protein N' [bacterium]|nr:primosomal protein N' [bacterium]MBU1634973.1 primosomal protein N' [bacterium]MBU1872771.1 primosomal protein N' [bacterium]